MKFDKDVDPKFDGWYERFENNGWRPVRNLFSNSIYRLVIKF